MAHHQRCELRSRRIEHDVEARVTCVVRDHGHHHPALHGNGGKRGTLKVRALQGDCHDKAQRQSQVQGSVIHRNQARSRVLLEFSVFRCPQRRQWRGHCLRACRGRNHLTKGKRHPLESRRQQGETLLTVSELRDDIPDQAAKPLRGRGLGGRTERADHMESRTSGGTGFPGSRIPKKDVVSAVSSLDPDSSDAQLCLRSESRLCLLAKHSSQGCFPSKVISMAMRSGTILEYRNSICDQANVCRRAHWRPKTTTRAETTNPYRQARITPTLRSPFQTRQMSCREKA